MGSIHFSMAITRTLGLESSSFSGLSDALSSVQRAINYNSAALLAEARKELEAAQRKEENRKRQKARHDESVSKLKSNYSNTLKDKLEKRMLAQPNGASRLGILVSCIVTAHPGGISADGISDFLSSSSQEEDHDRAALDDILPKLIEEHVLDCTENGLYISLNPLVSPDETPSFVRYPSSDKRSKPDLPYKGEAFASFCRDNLRACANDLVSLFDTYAMLYDEGEYPDSEEECKNLPDYKIRRYINDAKRVLDAMVSSGQLEKLGEVNTPSGYSNCVYGMKISLD